MSTASLVLGALNGKPCMRRTGTGNSASKAESLDQGSVSADVFLGEVAEQSPTFADDHLQTASPCGVVFVDPEVFGQFTDSFREDCDLDLGGTGVLFMFAKLLDRLSLDLGFQSFLFRASADREFGFLDDLP